MMILSQVCEIQDTRYPADSWIDSGWGWWVNVLVGALSTIPREHLRVIVGGWMEHLRVIVFSFFLNLILRCSVCPGPPIVSHRVSFMLIFLSSHLDSRIFCAQLCPRTYLRPRASLIGHGPAQFRLPTIIYWCVRSSIVNVV